MTKTKKYSWTSEVAPLDKVKFVGDAGQYYVAGINYHRNMVMIMGGARDEQWCRIDQLRLIERDGDRLSDWFKYNAEVGAFNTGIDALKNSFCKVCCPNIENPPCESDLGCDLLGKYDDGFRAQPMKKSFIK